MNEKKRIESTDRILAKCIPIGGFGGTEFGRHFFREDGQCQCGLYGGISELAVDLALDVKDHVRGISIENHGVIIP